MAALDFPSSPTLNQTYTANGGTWRWDGTTWVSANILPVASGGTGTTTSTGTGSVVLNDNATFINTTTFADGPSSITVLPFNGGSNEIASSGGDLLLTRVGGNTTLRLGTSGLSFIGSGGSGFGAAVATLDIGGNVAQNITTVSASAINCSLGNYFIKTASGALTWTFTNVPATRSFSVLLELTNGGTGTQTWPAAVKWPSGTAPTLTASGVDLLGFITDDGGTTWRGVQLMKDSK